MTVKNQLEKLEFHDSFLKAINVVFSPKPSCILNIDYYNWEMVNKTLASQSTAKGKIVAIDSEYKQLVIKFDFLAHIEYSEPDLINSIGSITCITLDYGLDRFEKEYAAVKQRFPLCKYPILEEGAETISIKFDTHSNGYVWIVGSGVSMEWVESVTPQEGSQLNDNLS